MDSTGQAARSRCPSKNKPLLYGPWTSFVNRTKVAWPPRPTGTSDAIEYSAAVCIYMVDRVRG